MKISREEEAKIPDFNSHDEAREWFKNKYGSSFVLTDSRQFEEKKIYFYHLVLDKENYSLIQKRKRTPEEMDLLLYSYQSIEISEDGFVHVIH